MGASSSNLKNEIDDTIVNNERQNITSGSSSNLKNGIVYEINDTIVKEEGQNYVQLNIGNINTQKDINGCASIYKYNGGEEIRDLTGIDVKGSECGKIEDEKYYSTCFLTPKNISVKGVDNPKKCKILYKAELKCEGDTLESFVNESDNNMLCIIIAIVLLIVFLYLKKKN